MRTSKEAQAIAGQLKEIETELAGIQTDRVLLDTREQGLKASWTRLAACLPLASKPQPQAVLAPKRTYKKREKPQTPTVAPTPTVSASRESGLYTCTNCGWTGDVAKGGKCPMCKAVLAATADLAGEQI